MSNDRLGISRSYKPASVNITIQEAAILQSYPADFIWPETQKKGALGLQIGNAVPPLMAQRIFEALWAWTGHDSHAVLDLFAGHGVGVALRNLGVPEHAVELDDNVVATRAANGMSTAYRDVWDAHLAESIQFDTLHGSPVCPTFSMAGNGSGRRQMHLVLQAIEDRIYEDIDALRSWSETLEDFRTGLTLVPLHYIWRFRPTFVSLEQVPGALPAWRAYADAMTQWGYSVKTANLQSEQYGVPQTRKRAILVARNDGAEVSLPTPTHSKYYARTPEKLDPGVKKWVSMAEALETSVDRPAPTVTGGASIQGDGSRSGTAGGRRFFVRSNYGSGGNPANRGRRMSDEPSATITSKFDRNRKEFA